MNPLTDVDLSAITARHAAAHGDLIEGLNDPANYDFARNAHRDMRKLIAVIAALQVQASKAQEALDEIQRLHTDGIAGPCPVCYDGDDAANDGDGLIPWPCPTAVLAGADESEAWEGVAVGGTTILPMPAED